MTTLTGEQKIDYVLSHLDDEAWRGSPIAEQAAASIRALREEAEWDVREFFKTVQRLPAGEGLSHEDGWTLMRTADANALREERDSAYVELSRVKGGELPGGWTAELEGQIAARHKAIAERDAALAARAGAERAMEVAIAARNDAIAAKKAAERRAEGMRDVLLKLRATYWEDDSCHEAIMIDDAIVKERPCT